MTLRCGGGTSSARDEYGRFVYMAPAQIGAMLNNVPTPWAVVFAGAIGSITYDLQTFCTTDPPADPHMTALDWVALINPGTLSASILARSKFRDFLGHYFWDQLCRCDSGAVPTPFTPPSAPSDLPAVNNPTVGPTYPTGTPCQTIAQTWTLHSPNTHTPSAASPFVATTALRADLTVTASRPMDSSDDTGYQIILACFNSSHTFLGNVLTYTANQTGSSTTTQSASLLSGTAAVSLGPSVFHVNSDVTVDVVANFYCDNGITPTAPTPCPADPFTQLQLDQLLQLVTLIQRQVAPFGYIAGTTHSGLSGDGSLSVQGLIGAKVSVVDGGYEQGLESGDPDAIYNVGWINWGNSDGYSERQWIGTTQFLTLPALAGQYTHLNYSLKPGVQVDVTELSREP